MKQRQDETEGEVFSAVETPYQESFMELSKSRSIFYCEREMTDANAADLAALLLYYDHLECAPITLYLNSMGGDVHGFVSIYDVIQMIKSPVRTIALGNCYSAAAVLLAAGSKGERYALPSAQIMIHGVQISFPLQGHDLTETTGYLKFAEQHNQTMMSVLAKHTGQSLAKIKQNCQGDVWMTAKQALEYGIIDRILE